MNLKLNGKIALVTGAGRKKSIGTAICRQLAGQGADIFFTYWQDHDGMESEKWPDRLCSEIQSLGVKCRHLELDLADPNAPDRLLDAVVENLGLPSILVNNAAHSTRDGFMALDAKTLDDHYYVNVRATCLLSVEFARRLQQAKQNWGRIINLISGQGQGPMPGELAYVASKGAIEAFTLTLSAELAPLGITVNAVNPGPTDTGWMTEEIKEQLRPQFLMGRIGLPEDAARLIGFLASDQAGWITGQTIHSEGGFLRK
ncbi:MULTISPECIES: SDR family oxidoreductase [Thermoactinomyces]|jgi:3-oxoacyl-[acyl-carrier protein] reductase|uniref:SDR family oxidoreductase n=1 Tax=Thermoactinomyces daqus TaxID=1329516 RepID=A0A7W1XBH7_9BACL|nr:MULTISPECIES: SDR family oxidoreductase [Thermoactinomyces]MBA4543606.1 SDR family oxidoreductase [Thermoactinomyces daqus]MBH8596531.1 SDR family oxidoreductase [Thermoactinomyces sp. CICC 10523]MBH8603293.1 SDR family oxidoreductase [Thermoactinomyces sp. CICC 10522]MBH8609041.1 SDR family oxidoreductase [Thermoactinomyces sp. CICC 10521]